MKFNIRFVSIVIVCIVSFSGAQAAEIVVLGPTQYERTKGAPNVYEEVFPGMIGEARLAVKNGEPSGKNRVSSAEVWINGELVVGPEQLNQNIASLQVWVVLAESNTISNPIKSEPGSHLTISIVQDVPIQLEAGRSGLVLESPDRLLVALPVENKGGVRRSMSR